MKSILNFFILGILVLGISSCSDRDLAIYDGNAKTNQTLLQIAKQSYDLALDPDGADDLEIEVQSSTKFDQDRQFDIEYVSDDIEGNTVSYSFDNTVTIPAGKYLGYFNVHAEDNSLQDQNFRLKLKVVAPENNENVILESNETTINIFRKE